MYLDGYGYHGEYVGHWVCTWMGTVTMVSMWATEYVLGWVQLPWWVWATEYVLGWVQLPWWVWAMEYLDGCNYHVSVSREEQVWWVDPLSTWWLQLPWWVWATGYLDGCSYHSNCRPEYLGTGWYSYHGGCWPLSTLMGRDTLVTVYHWVLGWVQLPWWVLSTEYSDG